MVVDSQLFYDMVQSIFILILLVGVFGMQLGFLLLEAGSVRSKNTSSIIFKNVADFTIVSLLFYFVGYAFATGKENDNSFWSINSDNVFLHNSEDHLNYFYAFLFCVSSITIVSGVIAERGSLVGYAIFVVFASTIIYPVASYWVWSPYGWLFKLGFVDTAGSVVVHVSGGTSALVAAIIIGPRIGRFEKEDILAVDTMVKAKRGESFEMAGYSTAVFAIGVFILWGGFFSFNSSSVFFLGLDSSLLLKNLELCFINVLLASVSATFSTFLLSFGLTRFKNISLYLVLGGTLAGCVASCAGCIHLQPYAMIITGLVAGVVYVGMEKALLYLRIDDPVVGVPVHLGGGLVGSFSIAVFSNVEGQGGWVVGEGRALWVQLVGTLAVVVWAASWTTAIYIGLKFLKLHRVSSKNELAGLDAMMRIECSQPETYAKGDFAKFKEFLNSSDMYSDFKKQRDAFNYKNERTGRPNYNSKNSSSKNTTSMENTTAELRTAVTSTEIMKSVNELSVAEFDLNDNDCYVYDG